MFQFNVLIIASVVALIFQLCFLFDSSSVVFGDEFGDSGVDFYALKDDNIAPPDELSERELLSATSPIKLVVAMNFPIAFSFLPGNILIAGERNGGGIYTYKPGKKSPILVANITGIDSNLAMKDGLINIAVHPKFSNNQLIFVSVSRQSEGVPVNEIIKIKLNKQDFKEEFQKIIFTASRVGKVTNDGGRLIFGPDGYLYSIWGDQNNATNAQNMDTYKGKCLRMDINGNAPSDNPFAPSLIYAFGLRNSIGGAFHPVTGDLWAPDNGPSCNDELNKIVSGGNFGWGPSAVCPNTNLDGANIISPLFVFDSSLIAPVGAVVLPNGYFLQGFYISGEIRRLRLKKNGIEKVTDLGTFLTIPSSAGSLLSIERNSMGQIFFSTTKGIYQIKNA